MHHNFLHVVPRRPPRAGIPEAVPWILVLLLAVAIVPFMQQPAQVRMISPPPPPPAATEVTVETQIPAEGTDSHHRLLPFTVYILSQQLSWKMRSTTDLDGEQMLLSPELMEALNHARDILCVGTASSEGAVPAEEFRAAQRAAQLAQWVGAAIRSPTLTRIWTLNAGQYRGPPATDSVSQRKAILIVTGPHDDEVDLGEGLVSGLERQQQASPVVYQLLHHYSRSREWPRELGRRSAGKKQTSRHRSIIARQY